MGDIVNRTIVAALTAALTLAPVSAAHATETDGYYVMSLDEQRATFTRYVCPAERALRVYDETRARYDAHDVEGDRPNAKTRKAARRASYLVLEAAMQLGESSDIGDWGADVVFPLTIVAETWSDATDTLAEIAEHSHRWDFESDEVADVSDELHEARATLGLGECS